MGVGVVPPGSVGAAVGGAVEVGVDVDGAVEPWDVPDDDGEGEVAGDEHVPATSAVRTVRRRRREVRWREPLDPGPGSMVVTIAVLRVGGHSRPA